MNIRIINKSTQTTVKTSYSVEVNENIHFFYKTDYGSESRFDSTLDDKVLEKEVWDYINNN